ncbi:MAG: hypothetical protein SFX18_04105 [Pirellulales bacterium]|nr:hypothetical protein [Pirellulales bacterium]
MRLTLRTLLAYMDESLKDPTQREEIAHKIEETEFARNLMQHIREVTQHLRLGTPKVHGKGMGGDANSVASYLDNVMPADVVQEFDKMLLQSDVHMAEVAACHQVLALVTSQPAEIDPNLRRKMYQIPGLAAEYLARAGADAQTDHRPNGHPPKDHSSAVAAVSPHPVTLAPRERPAVPEYLREPQRGRFWPVVATLLVAGAALLGIARLYGEFDRQHPWIAMTGLVDAAPAQPADGKSLPAAAPQNPLLPAQGNAAAVPANALPNSNAAPDADVASPGTNDPGVTAAGKNPPSISTPATDANPAADVNLPNAAASPNPTVVPPLVQPNAGQALLPEGTLPPVANIPATPDNATKAVDPNSVGDANAPPAPLPAETTPPGTPAAGNNAPVVDQAPPPGTDAPATSAVAASAAEGVAIGRLAQDSSPAVLRWNNTESSWQRIQAGEPVVDGSRILSLHTYRPTITLKSGISLVLVGETLVEFPPVPQDQPTRIRILFGQLVISNNGQQNTRLSIEPGMSAGTLVLNDPVSKVAISVRRYLDSGSDPETSAPQLAIDIYGAEGKFQWQGPGVDELPQSISSPAHLSLAPAAIPATSGNMPPLPKWIERNELNGFEQQATMPFGQMLDPNRPVKLVLRELAAHRRAEIRYLAARSLALIDDFELFIGSFNDTDQKAVWSREIAALQAALSRGPETAAKIRETFEQLRRNEGPKLYRHLKGYTKADLLNGALAGLLDDLESESLDTRVLAYHALRDVFTDPVTGSFPTFSYSPDSPAATRQAAAKRWRDHAKKELAKTPPAGQ